MQTYQFHELSERAQDVAMERYHEDQAITEWIAEWEEKNKAKRGFSEWEAMKRCAILCGWLFNEHGERIA